MAKEIKKLFQSLAANKVVVIDSIPRRLVKLAAILLSGRTNSHSSIIYFHSSRYLFLQKALLNMPQFEGIALFQNSQDCLKILITFRERLNKVVVKYDS